MRTKVRVIFVFLQVFFKKKRKPRRTVGGVSRSTKSKTNYFSLL